VIERLGRKRRYGPSKLREQPSEDKNYIKYELQNSMNQTLDHILYTRGNKEDIFV